MKHTVMQNFQNVCLILFLCAVGMGDSAFANTNSNTKKETLNKIREEFLKEKIRVSQEQIDYWKNHKTPMPTNKQLYFEAPHNDAKNVAADFPNIGISVSNQIESEVHAAINPLDSANIIVSPINQTGSLTVPIYYTKDFGKSWKKSSVNLGPAVAESFVAGGGDPMFAFDANGTAYFSWINLYYTSFQFDTAYADMYWAYSTDGGATWIREKNDIIGRGYIVNQTVTSFFDKQWMIVDKTDSPYRGNLYCAMLHADGDDPRVGLRTKNAKNSFFTNSTVRPLSDDFAFNQFAGVDIAPDGSVNMIFLASKEGISANDMAMYHLRSTDGGSTFASEQKITPITHPRFSPDIASSTTVGILNQRVYPCPGIVIDKSLSPYRGRQYVVWSGYGTAQNNNRGFDIFLTFSDNNGATWSEPKIVNDNTNNITSDQYYPSIAVNDNGVVIITWYDRRNDPDNLNTDYFMTYSFDGAQTFVKNFPVSSEPTDFSTVGMQNNGFGIGEYNQTLATKHYAIPVWADARGGAGNLNIYAAFIPLKKDITSVQLYDVSPVSESISMSAPYPLPTQSGLVSTEYIVSTDCAITLDILDIKGEVIIPLFKGAEAAGKHVRTFSTSTLNAGTYICRLETPHGVISRLFIVK